MADIEKDKKKEKSAWYLKYLDREFILIIVATILLILKVISPSAWLTVVLAALGKMEVKRFLRGGKNGKGEKKLDGEG